VCGFLTGAITISGDLVERNSRAHRFLQFPRENFDKNQIHATPKEKGRMEHPAFH
jgi:hypothetical protein